MAWTLLQGDVREKIKEIPEKSVHCVVTSPPYWGLRDYGVDGQIGLEKTPEEYVQNMVEVFRGVWRVLRDDGTVWLNLGDSYNGSGGAGGDYNDGGLKEGQPKYPGRKINTLKPKDLVGIPWRVAFALQADGWWLRSDIIWAKPNPMPESVTDRPTKAHEYIFLLTKKQKYFYDAEAVKEPVAESTIGRGPVDFGGKKGREYKPKKGDPNYRGGNEQWGRTFDYKKSCKGGRNRRTVWTVSTQPYPEAHFATFPPKLIEPCILAGTSPRACEICGSPWERVVEKTGGTIGKSWHDHSSDLEKGMSQLGCSGLGNKKNAKGEAYKVITTGWRPTCTCENEGKGRCIVLDPFAGSGTTLWVAEQHGRNSIGIELNPEYCKLISKRMDKMQMNIFSLGVSE